MNSSSRHRHVPPCPLVRLADMSGQSLLVPGELSPTRSVPGHIRRPEYVGKPAPAPYTGPEVQTPETVEAMRRAGRIAAQAMAEAAKLIAPGVTTDELDKVAHDYMCDHGAYPSTLGYRGFPKSLCTSVNEVICHGIPDTTVLRDGDIINIDITGYGVVRDFTGHGIGTAFHSGLVVPHYDAAPGYATVIEPGMTFTVEPMLTLGTHEWEMWADGWTVVTRDRRRSAQFEHTVLVTDTGAEILTLP